ncbi:MAG: class I SAM-dependent methyltransferase [Gammaproteobacteria bacterium]
MSANDCQNLLIAVTSSTPNLREQAEALATQLHLPYSNTGHGFDYLLQLTPKHLGLIKTGEKSLPLFVDFLSGKLTYRRQHASLRNEALARALGLSHQSSPKLVDATAGLARDSFILAGLGFEVQLLERSPLICALLEDGIKRAQANPHVAPIVNRLHLIQTDAISWLQSHSQEIDIIYLDPMFPERQKSALVKKEMRIFQDLIGEDQDAGNLMKAALACAKKRVVVKRPRLAEPIEGISPSFSLKGSSSRFDIYLIQEKHGNPTLST